MASRSLRFKAGISAIALLVAVFGAYGFRKLQALAADPTAEKDCRASGEQEKLDLARIKAVPPIAGVTWSQLGGTINDASCLNAPRSTASSRCAASRTSRARCSLRATTSLS